MATFHLPYLGIQRKRLLFPNVHDQTCLMFPGSQNSIHEHEATIMNAYVPHELVLAIIFHIIVTLAPVFVAIDINILSNRVKKCNIATYLSVFTMSCHLPAGNICLIWVNGNTEMELNQTFNIVIYFATFFKFFNHTLFAIINFSLESLRMIIFFSKDR